MGDYELERLAVEAFLYGIALVFDSRRSPGSRATTSGPWVETVGEEGRRWNG